MSNDTRVIVQQVCAGRTGTGREPESVRTCGLSGDELAKLWLAEPERFPRLYVRLHAADP